MSTELDRFVAAAPVPQRTGLWLLLEIARRPRGRRLLKHLGPLDQAANGVLAMDHFDQPRNALALGWDPAAVAARGRALRREEGRP